MLILISTPTKKEVKGRDTHRKEKAQRVAPTP